jgi:ribokinase
MLRGLVLMVKTVIVGAINWDINLFIHKFPREGEEVAVNRITRVPGGKAGNAAVAAARLLGPNQVAILSGLGRDSIAKEQVRIFEQEGVVTSGLKFDPEVESGQAYILIDESGENMIHTFFGANATIAPKDLDDPVRRTLIQDAGVVTIMDPPFETAVKLASEANSLGRIVAWDPGVKSELGVRAVSALLRNVDYIVANESETRNLTRTADPAKAASILRKLNPDLKVVLKRGALGSLMFRDSDRLVSNALDLKSFGLKVVNTVGCGDAYLGAFVAALSEGLRDDEAIRWANCAGGLKATRPETRGSPDRQTLHQYLARAKF